MCRPPLSFAARTIALNGDTSAPSMACVLNMVPSAHTVSTENAPSATASTLSKTGSTLHFHHHSTASTASPYRPCLGGRSGDRNRRWPPSGVIRHPRSPNPPAPAPQLKTASASIAFSTATAYCAAVRRYTRVRRRSSLRRATRSESSS